MAIAYPYIRLCLIACLRPPTKKQDNSVAHGKIERSSAKSFREYHLMLKYVTVAIRKLLS
jgi:hypothetical protein